MTEPHAPTPFNPWIVGILNVTPDSFSDGGQFIQEEAAIAHAHEMVKEGAHAIDVGGESSRPGAEPVGADVEWARIGNVVHRLAHRGVRVSVDTTKPEVARQALEAGAWMINDVDGMKDPEMLELVGIARCHVCIMHRKGDAQTMQLDPRYDNVVDEVREFLSQRAEAAEQSGVPKERICLDPGLGFGKTMEHNLELIRRVGEIAALGYPVMVGASRKAFIGKILGDEDAPVPPQERTLGTVAAELASLQAGASILRVHDVKAHVHAQKVWAAIWRIHNERANNEPLGTQPIYG